MPSLPDIVQGLSSFSCRLLMWRSTVSASELQRVAIQFPRKQYGGGCCRSCATSQALGLPLVTWKDNTVCLIPSEDIVVPPNAKLTRVQSLTTEEARALRNSHW